MHGYGKLYYQSDKLAYEGEWINDQFSGRGAIYNEEPELLERGFNYRNFDDLEEYWVKYEGIFRFIQANSSMIPNTEEVSCTYRTDRNSMVTSKPTTCRAQAPSTAKTAHQSPAPGAKTAK